MTKPRELREMADDQIRLVWKDAAESLFRLRLQAQTEKLAAPSVVRKHRRTIARCQTILAERARVQAATPGVAGAVAESSRSA
jgi:large subunit ribosomal protein L29